MGESVGKIENSEALNYTPVEVRYSGKIDPASPPIKLDGNILGQAIKESGSGSVIPVVVTDSPTLLGCIALYNSATNKITLYQAELVDFFRKIREREHKYLESPRLGPNRMKKFLNNAIHLLNPITAPYALLGNRKIHTFSGDSSRRERYYCAAREGFKVVKDGQQMELTREESISRAKDMVDGLIEKAAPFVVGWVLAHEYEHRNNVKEKLGLKASALLAPFFGGFAIASHLSSVDAQLAVVASGSFAGNILGVFARAYDEKESYDAGDKNYSRFAGAIKIDHEFFQKEVLGK